jgi:hypothetical protein
VSIVLGIGVFGDGTLEVLNSTALLKVRRVEVGGRCRHDCDMARHSPGENFSVKI